MMHTYTSGSFITTNPIRLAPCSGEMLDRAGTEAADSLFLRVIAFLHSSPPPSQVKAAHIRLPFTVSINVLSGCWVNTSSGSRPECSSHHSFLRKLLFNDALVWGQNRFPAVLKLDRFLAELGLDKYVLSLMHQNSEQQPYEML